MRYVAFATGTFSACALEGEERAGLTFCSGFPLAVHIYADDTPYMHDIYQGMWSLAQVECPDTNVRLLCVDAGLESCLSTPIIYLQYFHEGLLAKHRTSYRASEQQQSAVRRSSTSHGRWDRAVTGHLQHGPWCSRSIACKLEQHCDAG